MCLIAPRSARACSIAQGHAEHVVDPSKLATDHQAPSTPTITRIHLVQDHDSPPSDSCGDLSSLTIELDGVSDDQTDLAKIGYEIHLVSGHLPKAFALPTKAVEIGPYGGTTPPRLSVAFGESNEDVRFVLSVTAVDEAGNRSAPSEGALGIGTAGCNATGGPSSAASTILGALVIVGLGLRARRDDR